MWYAWMYIRVVTIHVFVPNRHGTRVYGPVHAEYTVYILMHTHVKPKFPSLRSAQKLLAVQQTFAEISTTLCESFTLVASTNETPELEDPPVGSWSATTVPEGESCE